MRRFFVAGADKASASRRLKRDGIPPICWARDFGFAGCAYRAVLYQCSSRNACCEPVHEA
jgi:hypothetical protein